MTILDVCFSAVAAILRSASDLGRNKEDRQRRPYFLLERLLLMRLSEIAKKLKRSFRQMNIGYKRSTDSKKFAIILAIVASALCAEAQSSGPAAKSPYTVSVFAPPPAGLTNPDSITTANGDIFVVYANATNPDGSGGFSTVVEYSPTGKMLCQFNVLGKADGLKYNPFDHKLWAVARRGFKSSLNAYRSKDWGTD